MLMVNIGSGREAWLAGTAANFGDVSCVRISTADVDVQQAARRLRKPDVELGFLDGWARTWRCIGRNRMYAVPRDDALFCFDKNARTPSLE